MNIMKQLYIDFLQRNAFKLLFFIITIGARRLEDNYEIEKLIYESKSMKTKIYVAKVKLSDRRVLIKTCGVLSTLVEDIKRRENYIVIQLNREVVHKLIRGDYDDGDENSNMRTVAFIYDYNNETTLKDYIDEESKKGVFTINEAIKILRSILIGIGFFNEKNLYLINLSFENILINQQGEIKFIDFSFIRVDGRTLTSDIPDIDLSMLTGTIAPEITDKKGMSQKSDVYSFGLIMQSIYSCVDFVVDMDTKNKYEDLMSSCLNKEVDKRIDVKMSFSHQLFKFLIPDLYEFQKLDDFIVKDGGRTIKKQESYLTLTNNSNCVRIIQNKNIFAKTPILHILKAEDFYFFANGSKYRFDFISNKHMEYIRIMLECVKKKALDLNIQTEVKGENSAEDFAS